MLSPCTCMYHHCINMPCNVNGHVEVVQLLIERGADVNNVRYITVGLCLCLCACVCVCMCMCVCVCACVCVCMRKSMHAYICACGGVTKWLMCFITEQKVHVPAQPCMCVYNHVQTSVCVLPLVVMACCVQSVIVEELVAPCELLTIL